MNLSVGRVRAGIAQFLLAFVVAAALVAPAFGQEPQTREEEARREREAKSKALTPPKVSGLERWLLKPRTT